MSRRARLAAAALLVLAASSPGCSVVQGEPDGYHLTAHFSKTVGLYPHGDVTLMGIDIGQVDAVELEDTGVRVEMTIDSDVPLPADVRSTIESQTLIGERNVVLFPAWDESRRGEPKAGDGDVIPIERTEVPVEPDEGLEAFNSLARSLDPDVIAGFVSDSADVLGGRGERLGQAIDDAASLTTTFAELDGQLLGAAESLHQLVGSLNTRQAQLQALVDTFASASGVLASEREGIRTFLSSLVGLTEEGRSLLDIYAEQLPADVAHLAALAEVINTNSSAIENQFDAFPQIAESIAEAYDPEIDGLRLRASATTSLIAFSENLREVVEDVLGSIVGGAG